LEIEWYATNPYFHPIVAGHGLPWGTPAEKEIPDAVILQVEQDLARAQLATQTPDPKAVPLPNSTADVHKIPQNIQPAQQYPSQYPAELGDMAQPNMGQPIAISNTSLTDASHFPPTLTTVQNSTNDLSGDSDSVASGTTGHVMTAYYPQFDTKNDDYTDHDMKDESNDPEIEQYLYRQRVALDELSYRGQGVFSRTQNLPKPDASRQYPDYVTTVPPPSQRIPGTADTLSRSNFPQDATQIYAAQPLPVILGTIPATPDYLATMPGTPVGQGLVAGEPLAFPGLPVHWPDPRGLIPDGPVANPQTDLTRNNEPIMRHIATYNGNDANFTCRLADYESLFVDDRRIGGWQGILRRRTDFISACCCMHIWEMLACRGGAGKAERITRYDKFWMNP